MLTHIDKLSKADIYREISPILATTTMNEKEDEWVVGRVKISVGCSGSYQLTLNWCH